MSKIVLALSLLSLVACGGRVVVDGDSVGSGGHSETTGPAPGASSISAAASGAGGDGGASTGDGGAAGGGGDEARCGDASRAACKAKGDTCETGSACYTFKSCYENAQGDAAAVQACVDAQPAGAVAWADLVACECACDWAPAGFCDGTAYGHPNG
jgi:hypothetical protein